MQHCRVDNSRGCHTPLIIHTKNGIILIGRIHIIPKANHDIKILLAWVKWISKEHLIKCDVFNNKSPLSRAIIDCARAYVMRCTGACPNELIIRGFVLIYCCNIIPLVIEAAHKRVHRETCIELLGCSL